ncbi:MAG: MGMT family protein [Candidatus Spechtbacterales bacterium]
MGFKDSHFRQTEFTKRIHDVVRQIPKGHVATYKEIAEMAGYPGAYRAVGTLMSKNYDPSIPCHRVIRSDGTLGGYNRGEREKILRLEQEGVRLARGATKKLD